MIGELAISFCERMAGEASLCLDIWSYPDGSCNLVVSASSGSSVHELVFPCKPQQLESVLHGKAIEMHQPKGSIRIERSDDQISARFDSMIALKNFRQTMPVASYEQAIEKLIIGTVGYLA